MEHVNIYIQLLNIKQNNMSNKEREQELWGDQTPAITIGESEDPEDIPTETRLTYRHLTDQKVYRGGREKSEMNEDLRTVENIERRKDVEELKGGKNRGFVRLNSMLSPVLSEPLEYPPYNCSFPSPRCLDYPGSVDSGGEHPNDLPPHFIPTLLHTHDDPEDAHQDVIQDLHEDEHHDILQVIQNRQVEIEKFKEIDEKFNEAVLLGKTSINEESLKSCVSGATEAERYEIAANYFMDALYGRKVRYGFRNRYIKAIYTFQRGSKWTTFTSMLAWMYLFISFFEPSNSTDRSFSVYSVLYWVLFTLESLDDILDLIVRCTDPYRSKKAQFLTNIKLFSKVIVDGNLFIDYILFWTLFSAEVTYFRYGRILRPFKLILECPDLRRFFKSVFSTLPYIFDMIILFILVALIFGIIGVKLFEDIKGDLDQDLIYEENNFNDIGHALSSLYILLTFSNYPTVMSPYYQDSCYYFLYFFPYMLLALIFLVPVPVAVIFGVIYHILFFIIKIANQIYHLNLKIQQIKPSLHSENEI